MEIYKKVPSSCSDSCTVHDGRGMDGFAAAWAFFIYRIKILAQFKSLARSYTLPLFSPTTVGLRTASG